MDTYIIAERGDWGSTILQTMPRLPRVLRSLRPTWSLASVCAIDADFLVSVGISALIWDVDGTLTHHHACEFAPDTMAHFQRLTEAPDLAHVILSNCGESRLADLGTLFPDIPVVKGYRTSSGPVGRVRHGSTEVWRGVPVGELTPLRKPDPALIEISLDVLAVRNRQSVAIVGDQHLTDIAAANLAGIRSIKVPTVGRNSCPPVVRALQHVDSACFHLAEAVRRV
ncbi:MAG: HAD hydrolase-like protein [Longimicrobiales bacterium]